MAGTRHLLSEDEFRTTVRGFRHTAYRLECLQRYSVDSEREDFERFRAGEPPPDTHMADFTKRLRAEVAAGKRRLRIHVVSEPLTDHMRFHIVWGYDFTTTAGEAVRIIPVRGDEWPADLPREDYWLLDSRTLLAMHYDDDGNYVGAEPVEDSARVVQANYWRDVAVSISVPYQEYRPRLDVSGSNIQ